MNTDKIKGFLFRIGIEGIDTECSLELLNRIQEACVLNIPYENLSILRGEPLPCDADALYDKIVTHGRGGYCFELNAFLHAMLEEIGFDTKSCFARFLRGEKEIPFRRHRIVIVNLDGDDCYGTGYYCRNVQESLRRRLRHRRIQCQQHGNCSGHHRSSP